MHNQLSQNPEGLGLGGLNWSIHYIQHNPTPKFKNLHIKRERKKKKPIFRLLWRIRSPVHISEQEYSRETQQNGAFYFHKCF